MVQYTIFLQSTSYYGTHTMVPIYAHYRSTEQMIISIEYVIIT